MAANLGKLQWTRQRNLLLSLLLLGPLLLVACGSGGTDNRRFAGEKVTTAPVSPTATVELIPTTQPNVAGVASPMQTGSLPKPHTTSAFTVLSAGNALFRIEPGAPVKQTWSAEAGQSLVGFDFDISSGNSVALVQSDSGYVVQFVDADGELVKPIQIAGPAASPTAAGSGMGGVALKTGGESVSVALPSGGIYQVTSDGQVAVMASANAMNAPGALDWSGNGQRIAIVNPSNPDAGAGIYVSSSAIPLDPVALLPSSSVTTRTIYALQFLDSANSVVYLTGLHATGIAGGDLLIQHLNESDPRLLLASGSFSPVASITRFSISPDQEVIALIVAAPNEDGSTNSTLVIQQLGASVQFSIPLPALFDVSSIGWTSAGLVVGGTLGDDARPKFYLLDSTGTIVDLTPPATPVASPSPLASPVAA